MVVEASAEMIGDEGSGEIEPGAESEAPETEDNEESEDIDEEDSVPSFDEWREKQKEEAGAKDESDSNEDDKADKVEDDTKEDETQLKTYKVKVDGKDEELEIPESEIPRLLSKALGADQKFNEASTIRKEAEDFVSFIKEDPIAAMERAGHNFQEIAENFLFEKMQYQQMNDQEREGFDAKRDLKSSEKQLQEYRDKEAKELKDREDSDRKRREDEMATHEQNILYKQMNTALEASGLPNNKFTISRMATYMREAHRAGNTAITPGEVIDNVRRDLSEAVEDARKMGVKKYKDDQKTEPKKPVVGKAKPRARKRITSIYDLME